MTGLVGQDGAFNSASCQITSCGAKNPVAGMLAQQIAGQINGQSAPLNVAEAKGTQMPTGGKGDAGKGPVGRA